MSSVVWRAVICPGIINWQPMSGRIDFFARARSAPSTAGPLVASLLEEPTAVYGTAVEWFPGLLLKHQTLLVWVMPPPPPPATQPCSCSALIGQLGPTDAWLLLPENNQKGRHWKTGKGRQLELDWVTWFFSFTHTQMYGYGREKSICSTNRGLYSLGGGDDGVSVGVVHEPIQPRKDNWRFFSLRAKREKINSFRKSWLRNFGTVEAAFMNWEWLHVT